MNKEPVGVTLPLDRGGCMLIQLGRWDKHRNCPAWKMGEGCFINGVETDVNRSTVAGWFNHEVTTLINQLGE